MLSKHTFHGLEAVLAFDNWPMLVLGRLWDRKTGLVIYRKNGYDILIDHLGGDECGTRMCIATDTYRKYLPYLNLSSPVRLLDLGANGGGFPLMLCINGLKIDRAVCVEMNPLTFQRLRLNLLTNLGVNAIAINAAVCAMPEGSEIPIKLTRGGTGESIELNQCEASEANMSVNSTSLAALMDRYFGDVNVDICKIDIEGEEFELLESVADSYIQRLNRIIIEFHYYRDSNMAKANALTKRLASLGFSDITMEEPHKKDRVTEVRAFAAPAWSPQKSAYTH